jgi:hypothetical protein
MESKIILNFNTIEEILKNNQLTNQLPHLQNEIHTWKLGQFAPSLRAVAQKAKLDFLNKLTEKDIIAIQEYLGVQSIVIEKLDYNLIKNHIMNISNIEENLNNMNVLTKDFCVYREADLVYISSIH